MKRIVLSLLTIVVALATVAGATYGLFYDQKSIPDNTFATGTLRLTLNDSDGKPFTVSNAYPDYWTGWEHMDIYNTGTLEFEAQISFERTGGDDELWDNLWITLETVGGDSVCHNGDRDEKVIYDGLIKNYPAGRVVSDIAYYHLAHESDGKGGPDNIRAGYSLRVCQRIGLPSTAGNSVQGKTVTFTEIVDALQDND